MDTPEGDPALASLAGFSRLAAPRMLRPYQLEAGEAVWDSVRRGEGRTFTILMARQSGKNELAAQLEAYLLHRFAGSGGQIVKAAPTFHPQLLTSMLRLREVLATPFSEGRWTGRHGHAIEMDNARILFLSADPSANVVGSTASILLAVDEAQDVYGRKFRPMAATTRATTVLYGTAWDEDNILEQQRRHNREQEGRLNRRLNFEAPWPILGSISPPYRAFVEAEIERLGHEHPTVKTQYLLEPISSVGRLFPAHLLERMQGRHPRLDGPLLGRQYVAGVDVAGQVVVPAGRVGRALNEHDETVITIADTGPSDPATGSRLPAIRVVRHYRWRDLTHVEQYHRMMELLQSVWQVTRVCVDATGVGAGLASFLHRSLPSRLDPVVFTGKSKSDLGFGLLSSVETGRLSLYLAPGDADLGECWAQLRSVRYRLRGSEEMEFSSPAATGHDDFVMSLALTVRAAGAMGPPAFGGIIRSGPTVDDGGW